MQALTGNTTVWLRQIPCIWRKNLQLLKQRAQSVRAEIRRQALKSDSAVINKTVNIFEDHIHTRNKIVIFFGNFGKIFLAEVGDAIVNSTAVV